MRQLVYGADFPFLGSVPRSFCNNWYPQWTVHTYTYSESEQTLLYSSSTKKMFICSLFVKILRKQIFASLKRQNFEHTKIQIKLVYVQVLTQIFVIVRCCFLHRYQRIQAYIFVLITNNGLKINTARNIRDWIKKNQWIILEHIHIISEFW